MPFHERKVSDSMKEYKQLDVSLELKSLEEDGRFAGYASVFDVVDNQRDVVERGAFSGTLRNRLKDIKLLWQHQMSEPIGVIERMFEDERGLYVEGRLLMSVAKAREAYALLKEKVVTGLSIGYSPVRFIIDAKTGVRKLKEVALWEVSLVTFPANDSAGVTVVKAAEETPEWRQARESGHLIALLDALNRATGCLTEGI